MVVSAYLLEIVMYHAEGLHTEMTGGGFSARFIALWVEGFVNSLGLIFENNIVIWRRSCMHMKGSLPNFR